MQPLQLAGAAAVGQRQMRAFPEQIRQLGQRDLGHPAGLVGKQGRDQPVIPRLHILPVKEALALLALLPVDAPLAGAEQAGEPRPAGAVLGPDQKGAAVHQVEPAAGDEPHPGLSFRPEPLDQPADRVAVGQAERGIAEYRGGAEQFLRAGDPAQEAEMAGDLKLDVSHANTPCMCQLRSPVPASSPSPLRNSQKRAPFSSST